MPPSERTPSAKDVMVIDMQARALRLHGGHVHRCPVCAEPVPCEDSCTIEPDLVLDDGTPCGLHHICEECEP